MVIQPREIIQLVYHIGDPSDTGTYYVQAKLRDTNSGTVLATANLTQSGRRFSGSMTAPQDNTGLGRYVDLTYIVYDDSGYSVPNTVYPEQNYQYLVQDRRPMVGGASESTAPEVDYKKIREIVDTSIARAKESEDDGEVEEPELDRETLKAVLLEVLTASGRDTSASITALSKQMTNVETLVPALKAEIQDFGPVFERFEEIGGNYEKLAEALLPALQRSIETMLSKEFGAFRRSIQLLQSANLRVLPPVVAADGSPAPRKTKQDYQTAALDLLKAPSRRRP